MVFAAADFCSPGMLGVIIGLIFVGYVFKKAKEKAVNDAKALGRFVSENPYAREVGKSVLHKVLSSLFR